MFKFNLLPWWKGLFFLSVALSAYVFYACNICYPLVLWVELSSWCLSLLVIAQPILGQKLRIGFIFFAILVL